MAPRLPSLRAISLVALAPALATFGCQEGAPPAQPATTTAAPEPTAAPEDPTSAGRATDTAATAEPTPAPAPVLTDLGPPTVTLLTPGAEPRAVLRYELAPGSTQTSAMVIDYQMDIEMPGIPTPPMVLPAVHAVIDTRVLEKAGDGVRYRVTLSKLSAAPRPGTSPPLIEAMKEALSHAEGATGDVTMDRRGFQHGAALAIQGDVPPKIRQMLADTERQIEQLSIPLPAEPVGIGARWQVSQKLSHLGIRIDQKTSYELVARTASSATVKVTVEQSAAPQTVPLTGMPGDAKAELTSLTSTGEGEIELRFGRVMPASAKMRARSEMAMTVAAVNRRQAVTTKTTTEVMLTDR